MSAGRSSSPTTAPVASPEARSAEQRSSLRRSIPWLALALIAAISGAARIWVNQKIEAPYILTDELQYGAAAERLATLGELPPASHGFLYPVLISPGWLSDSSLTGYEIVKAINVFLMTLVVIPVFLWARRLMRPAYAVATAGIVLMLPSFVYTGTLMTENAFFATFALSLFACALAVERPTLVNQLAALGSIVFALAVRQQGIVLVPILASATLLGAAFELRASETPVRIRSIFAAIRRYWVVWAAFALAVAGYLIFTSVRGNGLSSGLGAYSAATSVDYSLQDAARWVAYHFGELTLTSAVLPMIALIVVSSFVWSRSDHVRPADRAYVAVAIPALVLLVVQVGTFASRWSLRIEERNMFHIVPVLLIGVGLWVARDMPRPSRAVLVASVVAAVAIFIPPYGELLNTGLVNDTLGLLPMVDAIIKLDGGLNDLRIVMAAGALIAVVLFALVPRALARVAVPVAIAAFFLVSSFGVFEDVRRAGLGYRSAPSVGVDANWVDRTVGAEQDVLFIGPLTEGFSDTQKIRWQTEFFNRSVSAPVVVGANAAIDQATGLVVSLEPGGETLESRYVLADGGLRLLGRPLVERPPLALYEIEGPLRVAALTSGIFADGWTGETASVHVFSGDLDRPTTLELSVGLTGWSGPDVPANVEIRVGPLETGEDGAPRITEVVFADSVELHIGEASSFTVDAPPGSLRIEILVDRTVSPADFGGGDTRELGVQFSYAVR